MDTYNWHRPHEALNLQSTQEFLESLGCKFRVSQPHML
jgi:transposase InsO family protein